MDWHDLLTTQQVNPGIHRHLLDLLLRLHHLQSLIQQRLPRRAFIDHFEHTFAQGELSAVRVPDKGYSSAEGEFDEDAAAESV